MADSDDFPIHAPGGAPAGPPTGAERALLDLVGLAARARGLVPGTDATRRGVRDGEVRAVLLAADASPTQRQKLVPLLDARGVRHATCLSRDRIGAALGRDETSAVGFTNENFARRALELAAALADASPQD